MKSFIVKRVGWKDDGNSGGAADIHKQAFIEEYQCLRANFEI